MLRTRTTRPVSGALALAATLALSLCFGALGMEAHADDVNSPGSVESGTATASPDPTGQSVPPATSATNSGGAVTDLAPPVPVDPRPLPDRLVLRRGLSGYVNVATNDTCDSAIPTDQCTYSLGAVPTGWAASITPAGVMTVRVPAAAVPRRYTIGYQLSNATNPTHLDSSRRAASSYVTVAVTPDSYGAPSGAVFSHPYRKAYRLRIRDHVLRSINSTPPGARIQVATWSFASKAYRQALWAAKARGVTVQIVLAMRNQASNSDYGKLVKLFGTTVTPTGSWVRKCVYSCRGTQGTMHSKIFLFSEVYRTPNVVMTGSANLTDFAVTNQWNQVNTVGGTAYRPVYDEAVRIFTQMSRDRPVNPQYVSTRFANLGLTSYYYPRGAVSPANDFMMKALAPVRCTGAVNAGKNGRTIIKIAMYAWYESRGQWLAKRVRQLWQQGCQVQIVFAISSNPVKKILYSPAGRGRIPMRQILLTNKAHVPIYYLHDKWVAITGNYAGVRDNSISLQGSFNFSNLGFVSDEQFQAISGRAAYKRFAGDFGLLWTDRQARAPSPVSVIPTIEGRYSQNDLRLGTGTYRYMEAD